VRRSSLTTTTSNRHSGIGYHTPASVHFGTAAEVRAQRAETLQAAYATNPVRFRHRGQSRPNCRRSHGSTSPFRRGGQTEGFIRTCLKLLDRFRCRLRCHGLRCHRCLCSCWRRRTRTRSEHQRHSHHRDSSESATVRSYTTGRRFRGGRVVTVSRQSAGRVPMVAVAGLPIRADGRASSPIMPDAQATVGTKTTCARRGLLN